MTSSSCAIISQYDLPLYPVVASVRVDFRLPESVSKGEGVWYGFEDLAPKENARAKMPIHIHDSIVVAKVRTFCVVYLLYQPVFSKA